jgi:type IV pilus assembly protein PilA
MILKLRQRMSQDESGFTLVELLVVMLILGILAAIAIPAFLNQRSKANDSDAKTAANTAQTAIETLATDNNGSYASANGNPGALTAIEPALNNASFTVVSGADTYTITVTADTTNNTFSVSRAANGTVTHPCTVASASNRGGCPGTGGNPGDWGT